MAIERERSNKAPASGSQQQDWLVSWFPQSQLQASKQDVARCLFVQVDESYPLHPRHPITRTTHSAQTVF
jgi:hypothetical protein